MGLGLKTLRNSVLSQDESLQVGKQSVKSEQVWKLRAWPIGTEGYNARVRSCGVRQAWVLVSVLSLTATWPWMRNVTSLSLGFYFCKIEWYYGRVIMKYIWDNIYKTFRKKLVSSKWCANDNYNGCCYHWSCSFWVILGPERVMVIWGGEKKGHSR